VESADTTTVADFTLAVAGIALAVAVLVTRPALKAVAGDRNLTAQLRPSHEIELRSVASRASPFCARASATTAAPSCNGGSRDALD
jgi:hypothetical protein